MSPSSYICLSIHQAILHFDAFQSELQILVHFIPKYFSTHINESSVFVYGSFLQGNLPPVKCTHFKLTIQCVFDKRTHFAFQIPIKIQDISLSLRSFFLFLPSEDPSPYSQEIFFYYRSVLPVLEHHVSGIIQYILFLSASFQ